MSSLFAYKQIHQDMSASFMMNVDHYIKIAEQSPSSIPITNSSIVVGMNSTASSNEIRAMPPNQNQLVMDSTHGSDSSSQSLASRNICRHVVQEQSPEDDTETLVKITRSECETTDLERNDPRVNGSEISYSQSPHVIKSNSEDIPPRHSRSGSPLLITDRRSDLSKTMQYLGTALQGPSGEDFKEISSTEITAVAYKSELPPSDLKLESVWNENSHPRSLDEMSMDDRDNLQPYAAFHSDEDCSKKFHPATESKSGPALITCTSHSLCSAISPLHRRSMDSVGMDAWSDNLYDHRDNLDFDFDAIMRNDRIAEKTSVCLHSLDAQKQDGSRKLFCTEPLFDRTFSKEADYNEELDTTSDGCLKTSGFVRNQRPVTETITSLAFDQHSPNGGSSRNFSRTCSHCGTMKTPLWRTGPSGPKSLCNACGIRLKKAGRRLAMTEGMESFDLSPPTPKPGGGLTCKPSKRKINKANDFLYDPWTARARLKAAQKFTSDEHISKKTKLFPSQFRKSQDREVLHEKARNSIRRRHSQSSPSNRSERTFSPNNMHSPNSIGAMQTSEIGNRVTIGARHKFERLESTNSSHLRRVFAKDEEEGAVLLMVLSYGLVNA